MDEKTINKILGLARPETVEIHEQPYATGTLQRVAPASPHPLHVQGSLQAVVDYLVDVNDLGSVKPFVHVVAHNEVHVLSQLNGPDRWQILVCTVKSVEVLGKWMPVEQFLIWLQTSFRAGADRDDLLRLLGNLRSGMTKTQADDGVTQTVTARVGIVQAEDVPIRNPNALQPYRTFRELEQPMSHFVVRLREGAGAEVALFEADGSQWQLEAIGRIKEWFAERVGVPVIG